MTNIALWVIQGHAESEPACAAGYRADPAVIEVSCRSFLSTIVVNQSAEVGRVCVEIPNVSGSNVVHSLER